MGERTKRLTIGRALELLQLRYGTQVENVGKIGKLYFVNRVLGETLVFTRDEILKIEDDMYSGFGY